MLTVIVMIGVIVWATKNICKELGVGDVIRSRWGKRKGDE